MKFILRNSNHIDLLEFEKILTIGSKELFEDNPDKMESPQLIPTSNKKDGDDVRLFFIGLQEGLIKMNAVLDSTRLIAL